MCWLSQRQSASQKGLYFVDLIRYASTVHLGYVSLLWRQYILLSSFPAGVSVSDNVSTIIRNQKYEKNTSPKFYYTGYKLTFTLSV
jgi:hypothetical protein